jgi:protoporphyrinogen oxidase
MGSDTFILGAGMTGLAAGYASGLPIFEEKDHPGGICSSYYIRPGETKRLMDAPDDSEAYRFEIGGGHWIFGGDPAVLHFIQHFSPAGFYKRRSSVHFHEDELYVPYPIQNHLRFLDHSTASRALAEMAAPKSSFRTMKEWMNRYFGETLCRLFFYPFHELYTAGLYERIAPQDVYKSPVDLSLAIKGAFGEASAVGYNVTFVYPEQGLNVLARRIAESCTITYEKRIAAIDVKNKKISFDDGASLEYQNIISTLPLNTVMDMCGLSADVPPDPYTSVLVLNIGAVRGKKCPDDHWLYNTDTRSGFHRVGFYSNVDASFLPAAARTPNSRVSIYVERAFRSEDRLSPEERAAYADSVVEELQQWGFIEDTDVVDHTWIDVAYTWSWPQSAWKPKAQGILEQHGIFQVGRYGRWAFQGLADSIRDGLLVGAAFKQ